MRAYDALLASPLIAVLAIAMLLLRYPTSLRKTGMAREDTPAAPPAISRVDTDGLHLVTTSGKGGLAPRATSVTMPPSHDSVLPAPRNRDGVDAAGLTGARLIDLSDPDRKRSFPIPTTGVTIGRSPYVSEIVLRNSHISSRHAWIGFIDGQPVLRDLCSTNGTYLNGRFNSPVTEVVLRSGDMIFFCGRQGEQLLFMMD